MSRPVGRPVVSHVLHAWVESFDLKYANPFKDLPDSLLNQLSLCRSDEARRLILGISEQGDTGYSGGAVHRYQFAIKPKPEMRPSLARRVDRLLELALRQGVA